MMNISLRHAFLPAAVSRSVRRELVRQWQHNRHRSVCMLMLVGGAVLGGISLSWLSSWNEINNRHKSDIEFSLGLLEMRLKEHFSQAQLWSHQNALHELVEGRNTSLGLDSLRRSIAAGDQHYALVLNRNGEILAQAPQPVLSRALTDCIQQRVARMQTISDHRAGDLTAGLYCAAGQQVVVGAISTIGKDHHAPSAVGYLVHLSPLQRQSYTSAVREWFRRLANDLEIHPGAADHLQGKGMHLNDLLPANQHLDLKQEHTSFLSLTTETFQAVLLPWLTAGAIAAYLSATTLLALRHHRLDQARQQLKGLRRQRMQRLRLKRMLVTPRQLQHSLDTAQDSDSMKWIACLDFTDRPESTTSSTRNPINTDKVTYELVEGLRDSLNPEAISRVDSRKLVLLIDASRDWSSEEVLTSQFSEICSRLTDQMKARQAVILRALISPVEPSRGSLQIRDLVFQLSSMPLESGVQIWRPQQPDPTRTDSTSSSSGEYDERWLELMGADCHEQHPSIVFRAGQATTLYTRLTFNAFSRLLETSSSASFLPLRMLHQSKDSPALDRHMLQQALAMIENDASACGRTLVRLSGNNLSNQEAFNKLLHDLESRSTAERHRLIVEFEAGSLLSSPGYCRQQIKQLQELGVSIAIDDTAINAPPIKAIFTLKPNYLIVGPGLADHMHDPNADNVVEFLLAYCKYKHCLLVMTEVSSSDAIAYWQNRGVTAFEGDQPEMLAA